MSDFRGYKYSQNLELKINFSFPIKKNFEIQLLEVGNYILEKICLNNNFALFLFVHLIAASVAPLFF